MVDDKDYKGTMIIDLFLQIVLEVIKTIVREIVFFVIKKITSGSYLCLEPF